MDWLNAAAASSDFPPPAMELWTPSEYASATQSSPLSPLPPPPHPQGRPLSSMPADRSPGVVGFPPEVTCIVMQVTATEAHPKMV